MVKKQPQEFNYWALVALVAVIAVLFLLVYRPGGTQTNNYVGGAMRAVGGTPTPVVRFCTDGTLLNSCSATKPKLCTSSGQLTNNCLKCGCPGGYLCQSDGSCSATQPFMISTYIHDDLDGYAEAIRFTEETQRFLNGNGSFGNYSNSSVKILTPANSPILILPNGGFITNYGTYPVNEEQHVYLFAYTAFDESVKRVQAKYAKTGYEVVFSYPLPLCFDQAYEWWTCPANKRLDQSNLKIWFLGSAWYVRNYQGTTFQLRREDGKTLEILQHMQIGDNTNWKGAFATGSLPNGKTGITKIYAYNDIDQTYKVPIAQTLDVGDSINIIKNVPGYKFMFFGPEIVDYDLLQFSIMRDSYLFLENGVYVFGTFAAVTTTKSNGFQYGSISTNQIYIGLDGVYNGTNSTNSSNSSITGDVFYPNNQGQYFVAGNSRVPYYYSSSGVAEIFFPQMPGYIAFRITENTEDGQLGTQSYTSTWHTNLLYDRSIRQFVNFVGMPGIDKIGYSYGLNDQFASKEMGHITYGGTRYRDIYPYTISLVYPREIVHAKYGLLYGGDDIVWRSPYESAPIDNNPNA